jgi:hypothetical protein
MIGYDCGMMGMIVHQMDLKNPSARQKKDGKLQGHEKA